MNAIAIDGPGAVSYTHRDVYKRQLLVRMVHKMDWRILLTFSKGESFNASHRCLYSERGRYSLEYCQKLWHDGQ